jgi:hypothetical protein
MTACLTQQLKCLQVGVPAVIHVLVLAVADSGRGCSCFASRDGMAVWVGSQRLPTCAGSAWSSFNLLEMDGWELWDSLAVSCPW